MSRGCYRNSQRHCLWSVDGLYSWMPSRMLRCIHVPWRSYCHRLIHKPPALVMLPCPWCLQQCPQPCWNEQTSGSCKEATT